MKINYFVDIIFELYDNIRSYGYKNDLSLNDIKIYILYEKPIEEYKDKIYLFTYWKEYKFNFEEMINYYEYKDCKKLEIDKINNLEHDSKGYEKYKYHILYHDKYFHVENISKLIQLEYLYFSFYKYNDLNIFYNTSLIELKIGSTNIVSYIKSISGISNFNSLSKIIFINCIYLENVVDILQKEKHYIKELFFIYCDKIDYLNLTTYCKENEIKLSINFCLT